MLRCTTHLIGAGTLGDWPATDSDVSGQLQGPRHLSKPDLNSSKTPRGNSDQKSHPHTNGWTKDKDDAQQNLRSNLIRQSSAIYFT